VFRISLAGLWLMSSAAGSRHGPRQPAAVGGCVFVLPLAKLTPGEYLIRSDASANGRASGRTLRFSVE
jgi:hypothetical protein